MSAIHLWAAGASGQPALELRRMLKLGGYNTSFTLISKLREGLLRGFNTGLVSGVAEMDAAGFGSTSQREAGPAPNVRGQ